MKTIKLLLLYFMVLLAAACNNQQRKEVENETFGDTNQAAEKIINTKVSKTEKKEIKTSEKMVNGILTTSPRYKQLTKGLLESVRKNGGQSFGIRLEGSPDPQQDNSLGYSKTYDYTLYEMYTEREVNTARFSFDPQKKLLFEYDVLNNKLIPIEFDRKLLIE